mgnify:FL=1
MMKSLNFSDRDIEILEEIFIKTIEITSKIYGEKLFRPYDFKLDRWKDKPYKEYYDAVMVGFSRHLKDADILLQKKHEVIKET